VRNVLWSLSFYSELSMQIIQPIPVTQRILTKALELLEQYPDGLRYSELKAKILPTDADFMPNTITGCLGNLVSKFPDKVYKPSKGLYCCLLRVYMRYREHAGINIHWNLYPTKPRHPRQPPLPKMMNMTLAGFVTEAASRILVSLLNLPKPSEGV
jgi:hypothetical protein